MKKSCHKVTAVIPALLLVACVDNRNDFTGASPNSEETTSYLPAPENLSATASDNEVSLSWDTVDGASAYNVYIYNQSGYIQSNYSPANLSAADASVSAIVSTNSHLLSSLEYEVDYYFNVTALADDLESNQSNEVGVRPLQNFNNSTPSVQLLNTNVNAAEVVTLSAEVSDPDGNNISYLWQQTSGASIDIIDGNESEASFTAPTVDAPVELGFALTVFDNLGASSTSSATVTVSDNLSPQVDAGADQSVSPGATVDLLGSASDSDGSVVDIAWQQESGSIVSLSSNSTLDTSFTAPSANSSELTLVFQLSVTDDRGASATDTVTVLVAADQGSAIVYRVDVAENSNGTIHVATTMDPEQESLTYSLSGTDADDFSIDSSSGAISFTSTPDYEVPTDANTDNSYELTFAVSNGTTTTLQDLVITVIDVNEAPTITSTPDASTPENTTITYTATATDPENTPLSYSLSGTDAANFSIDPSSGAISFTTIPDYENPVDTDANNVYALTLEVSDSTHTTSQALTITVTNIDEPPSITSAASTITPENTTTTIYTTSASDPENSALSYSLSATDAAHLSINPSSGAISFAINPDYENPADSDANNIYELMLEVSDSTHTTSQALAITVDDANDNAPIITATQSFSIDENSATGTVIGTVIVTDADANPTTYQDWTITSGNTNVAFAINSSSGELSVATSSELDHESTASYTLALSVSDGVNTASAETVTINVNDLNDNTPVITASQSFDIDENSANTTSVGTVAATDADSDAVNSFTWSIADGNDNNAFAINSSTGEIAVANSSELDYENGATSYTLSLTISDGDTISSAETVIINVNDLNDNTPVITASQSFDINENSANGTSVNTVAVSDADVIATTYQDWKMTGGNTNEAFAIDSSSGEITVADASQLDYETTPTTYNLSITVSDGANTSSAETVTINVNDLNDNAPIITTAQSFSIDENSANGTTIGIVVATDVDTSPTTYQDWTITSGNTNAAFAIDSSSGELSVATSSELDYESTTSYTLALSVSDGVNTASAETLSINVNDVNDNAPIITPSQSFEIAENSTNGSIIGTVVATDIDTIPTTYQDWTITSGNTNAAFAIDSSSGELSVAISSELDHESTASYTLALSVSDGVNTASAETLSINLSNVNEQPSFTSASTASTNENNNSFVYTATATDVDAADSLAYSISGGADAAAFTLNGASLSFIAIPNYESPADSNEDNIYQVELQVTDAGSLSDDLSLSISVLNVAETEPSFTSSTTAEINENDDSFVYTAIAEDVDDDDTQTYSIIGGSDQLSFSLSGASLSFKTAPNYESFADADNNNIYDVDLRVTDADGLYDDLSLSISVLNVDETEPSFTSSTTADINENDDSFVYTAIAADVDDDDTQTYSIIGGSDQLSFSLSGSSLSFKTAPNYESFADTDNNNIYDVDLRVTDADGLYDDLSLSISVLNVAETKPSFTSAATASIEENDETFIYTAAAADVDAADTQTYSIIGGSDQLSFSLSGSSLGFKTAPNYESFADSDNNNIYDVDLRVTDADGLYDDLSLSISVLNVDETKPSFTSAATASIEENDETFIYTAAAADVDAADTQTYSIIGGSDQLSFSLSGASLSFKTAPNYESFADADNNNIYDVDLRVTDADGLYDDLSLSISVLNVDETGPSFTSSTTAEINENDDSFVYTAIAEDVDDGDTLTYSIIGGADQLSFSLSGASLSFKTAPNYESFADADNNNIYDVDLRVTDADGLYDDLSLSISVLNVDETEPSFTSSTTAEINENDDSFVYTAIAEDVDDGDTQTYSIIGGADQLSFSLSGASLGFKTAPNYESFADADNNNIYDIDLRVTDADGLYDDLSLSISVLNVDETEPSFTSSTTAEINENDDSFVYTAIAEDVDDGDTQTYSIIGGADQLSFSLSGASLGFKIAPNYESFADADNNNIYDVDLRVTDADGLYDDLSLSISVLNVDETEPSFTSSTTAEINENDDSFVYTAIAEDVDDGDTQTYSIIGGSDQLSFSLSGASLGFKTAPNYESFADADNNNIYDVDLRVTDADGLYDDLSLSISVLNVDETEPSFTSSTTAEINENDDSFVYTAIAEDVDDGDTQTYSIIGGADQLSFSLSGASLSFKTAPNHESFADADNNNIYDVDLRVTDADGLYDDLSLSISVLNVAETEPSFTSAATASIEENDETFIYTAAAADVDAADTQTYSIIGGADQLSFSLSGASLGFKTAPNYESFADADNNNIYDVDLRVTDADGLYDDLSLSISVLNVDETKPSFTSAATASIEENDETFIYTAAAADVDDGDTQTYSIIGGADQLSFSLSGASLGFKTAPNYESFADADNNNIYDVDLRVTDADGLYDDLSLSISVLNVDETEPSFTSSTTAEINENDDSFVYTAIAEDVDDGDTQTYSIIGGADQLSFSLSGASLGFKTAPNYESFADADNNNIYDIDLRVTDADGLYDDLSLSISVLNVDETEPSFTSSTTAEINENDDSFVYTAIAEDVDDGDTQTYSIIGGADQLSFSLSGASLGFKTAPNYESFADADNNNIYDVDLRVTDADGLYDDLSLSISVLNVAETEPSFTSAATASIEENDETFIYTAAAADVDDGDTQTYSIIGGSDQLSFSLSGASLGFKTAPNYESFADADNNNIYDVDLRVTDADGLYDDLSLSISVLNVDETEPSFTSSTTAEINENDDSFVYTAIAEDVDVDDTRTYSIIGGSDQLSFSLSGASLGFKTAPNYESFADADNNNIYDVDLRVTDADGLYDDLSLSISVLNVDETEPSFTSSTTADINENDDSFVYTAIAADVDAADTQTYSIIGGSDQLSFSLSGASLSFKTAPNYESFADADNNNIYDVDLRVTDADGLYDDLSLSISVLNVAETEPSFTSAATASIEENDETFIYTAAAADVDDGDTQTYSIIGGADQLSFSLSGASLGFKTAPNYESFADADNNNIYDVDLRVTDADGLYDDLSLSISVLNVDETEPSFTSSTTAEINENDDSFVYTAIAEDVDDGDTQTYSIIGGADQLSFSLSGASLGFKTAPNYESFADADNNNIYDVDLRVTDADGLYDDLSLSISVLNVDETEPSFTSSTTAEINENDDSFVYTAIAEDVDDGDTQTYSIIGGADQLSFSLSGASLGFKTAPNYESFADADNNNIYDVDLRVTDADGLYDDLSLSISVLNVDETEPSFTSSTTAEINENDDSFVYTAIAADVDDGDTQTYSIIGGSDQLSFSLSGASLGFKTAPNYESFADADNNNIYDVDLRVTDADGLYDDLSLSISVLNVDETEPSFTSSTTAEINENDDSFVYTAIAEDVDDGDTQTYSIIGGADQLSFSLSGASLSFKTAPNHESFADADNNNIYDVDLRVTDADGLYDDLSLSISVLNVAETEPSFTSAATASIEENDETFIYTAAAADVDAADTQTYSIIGGADQLSFSLSGASLGFKTAPNYESFADADNNNIYDVDLRVTDADGLYDDLSLSISVLNVDETKPSFTSAATASIEENDETFIYTAAAADVDAADTQTYSIIGGSDQLSFSLSGSSLSFKTAPNYESFADADNNNIYDIDLRVTDADGLYDDLSLSINVTDINDNTPIITASQSFDIDEASANGTSVGTVALSDADSAAVNTFTWSITGGNTNDAFDIDDSTGEITVANGSELDYESGTILYTLALTVSDGATTSAAEDITINILDVSEHDAAPSAAYLGLPDNYINITFTPESGVSYQLHRSFVEGCTSSSCDAEGYKLFASPNSSGTADTMTFSQTHYYSLVGDNSTTFTTSINDSDGAKLAALVTAQSLSTEYDLANDWVNISATDSNNVTYTLYMAGEPFAAGGCEDSELDNIGSLCADGSSLSDGNMHSATEVINWSARRYYRLDIGDGYQVVHSLESNASVIDPVVLNASNASLTIDITWSALNSSKLAEYTVYLSDDSAATTASAATWSSLSNPQIISGNGSELYSLVPILSQYYVAITATNTESETTPLSKVYLANNIVTGDPDPSTWHEIIADTDDSPAHWEGRFGYASLVHQDKMWVIGGRTANAGYIGDVWSSTDGYNWTEVTPSAAFNARREFVSMVHEDKMWVLGGDAADVSGGLTNDVWYSSDGATWHEATPAASWHARDYFGGVSFASGATDSDEIWVLGHYDGDPRARPEVDDHYYSTDGSTWSIVKTSGLPPISAFPAVVFNGYIFIAGGDTYVNSAWSETNSIYSSADGVNWAELSVSGSIWDARSFHSTLVYDDKLWVFAGSDASYSRRDDYWYSSADGTQWYEVTASGSKWEAREVHTSVNYAGRMWILGGSGSIGDGYLNDVWASGLEITSFSFNLATTN